MIKIILLSAFVLIQSVEAVQIPLHHPVSPDETVTPPWFTGPLLAPSGLTIPAGHYNIEPYIYGVADTGRYGHDWKPIESETFWNTYLQPSLQFGISSRVDVQLNPTLFYNYTEGVADWALGDLPIGIDIQLYHPKRSLTQWNTAVKLALKETVPLGKYRNLDPKKRRTDAGGGGSWQTGIGIVWGNVFYLGRNHFLTWRNSLQYTLPAPVRVKNLNAYGGGAGTYGTVYPAQNLTLDTAIEINLTQQWVVAMDIVGAWFGKTRFKGTTHVANTAPAGLQFSLAPAIEYNWSENLGVIAGPWFTVAGKNAAKFSSAIIALNYYH